jgi:hypothetical protein
LDLEYFPLHAVASLLASLFTFLVALLVQGRARLKEESRPFVLICLLISFWTFFPFASWKLNDSAHKIWVLRALYMAASAVPASFAWLIFSILHKRDKVAQRIQAALWGVTGVFVFFGLSPWFIRNTVIVHGLHGIAPGLPPSIFLSRILSLLAGSRSCSLIRVAYERQLGSERINFAITSLDSSSLISPGRLHFLSMYFHREPVPHDLVRHRVHLGVGVRDC